MSSFDVRSPIDGSIVATLPLAGAAEIAAAVSAARAAQRAWRGVKVADRAALVRRFVEAMQARKDGIAQELTRQMGRPIRYTPGEVNGLSERATTMAGLAPDALADVATAEKAGFTRFIRKDPLGLVFVIAPWNYPYLTAVNAVVPALLAGNAVLLKHSSQTPLVAERFAEGFKAAGLPAGLLQVLHLSHADTEKLIGSPDIDFV
jgi:acyl-CoA reductase-like NAD-dependent aldehyde dehydrogenase